MEQMAAKMSAKKLQRLQKVRLSHAFDPAVQYILTLVATGTIQEDQRVIAPIGFLPVPISVYPVLLLPAGRFSFVSCI